MTAALHAVEAGGFTLCGYAAADGPFFAAKRQVVAGVEAQDVFRRV